jgi:hypothetical protein
MVDDMLVKGVTGNFCVRIKEPEFFPWRKPLQSAFALANRTITGNGGAKITFYFEFNVATVATALIQHVKPPDIKNIFTLLSNGPR